MKKLFPILALCLSAFTQATQAQETVDQTQENTSHSPIKVNLRGGLNFANIYIKNSESGDELKDRTAYNLGLLLDIPFKRRWTIQTGLLLNSKGFKERENESIMLTCTANYLEVPFLFTYHNHFTLDADWQLNIGPYFAYGIDGTARLENTASSSGVFVGVNTFGQLGTSDVSVGLNHFDAGLSLGTGFLLYQKFYIGFQAELGIADILNHSGTTGWDDDYSAQNKTLSINIGCTL